MIQKEKQALKEALLKRASVLQVPFDIRSQLVALFCSNVDASGVEWTITRFKSVKTDFLRFRAGLQIETPWIKKKNNYFLGTLGSLQRWSMKSDKRFAQAIQLLQIYTYFISPEVTEQQAMKFVDAVQSNVQSKYFDHYANILLFATKEVFPVKSWYSDPGSLLFRSVSNTKSEPHANGRSYDEGDLTLNCANSFLNHTVIGRQMVTKYPALFSAVMSGVASAVFSDSQQVIERPEHHNIVGKIGLIQEPGFKLRAVANPARVYQQALKPLGDDLYSKLSQLPWDCTHDQSFPFNIIQKHLREGGSTHAVDLSNATDMFPFSLQERMLHSLYHRTDAINLFADLSRADWMCDLVPGSLLSWSTGQPLGLFPSFASFALAHGLMLYGLNSFSHNNKFFVLGDDVVILDDELNRKYKLFLSNMGIPYSISKTLSSTQITEFGGKVITPNSVIPQLKWRQCSDDSFMDISRLIGERVRPILRERQRKIFDVVKVIPDFLGGCGLNPAGIPLEERCHLYYKLFSDESLQSYLLSYNGRISALNYEVPFPRKRYSSYRVLNSTILQGSWFYPEKTLTDTFDQKVISLAKEIPLTSLGFKPREKLSSFPWTQTFGSVLYNAFPRERYMQLEHRDVSGTHLEVLERKVKKL
jgi:hypothetical protein